ncbi:MAG: hypothetical protein A2X56_06455 [Nitrospirae bacterium GWC2_57_13]|nr:MAG: hypothetical protein A2X56_06455 [Nitrospirae bacterium GWC2_57_13]OGW42497.1 MAG: hypothetical protein A2X57_10550 [Nitrospirae bacterium GWD2_57_8]
MQPDRVVYRIAIDDVITQVTADYVAKSIDKATEDSAEALVIVMNTPGGVVPAMESIVQKILSSDVPIIAYVSPSGAHAASAGVFIVLSANIASMAPSTRMGSAHPVTGEGQDLNKTMKDKVVNDLTALIRGIAEKRGRNATWAEQAVRKSVSATEREALKLKIIDLIAVDLPSLLKEIDGRSVEVFLGKKTLRTAGAQIKDLEKGFRITVLEIIGNPNIAYILMILGFYGLYFELSNPGAIFPGVVGAILIIVGFYALHMLPINYAGLLLIILGISLFIAEAFITSGGILGVGGAVAMFIGSVMLIDSPLPELRLSWAVIIPVVGMSALLFIITLTLAIRIHREQPDTGTEGLVGRDAEARTDIAAEGQVFVHGEYWNAVSDEPVKKGERVKIVAVDGLKVKVKKTG